MLNDPTRGVDVGAKWEIYQLCQQLAAQGMGLVFVTHFLNQVYAVTDRITVLIFLLSGVLSGGLAFLVSRHLTRGLYALKAGADSLGTGNLDYHITLPGKDELGELANAFNVMAFRLRTARADITRANAELESRHQELQVVAIEADQLAQEVDGQHVLPLRLFLDDDLGQDRAGDVLAGLGILDREIGPVAHHLGEIIQGHVGTGGGVVEPAIGVFLDDDWTVGF
jgi:methyl-accepting chemotaxis protein